MICPRCGTNLDWSNSCPKCGYKAKVSYSGTVVVSGSTFSAFDAIIYARNMLASVAESEEMRAPFIQPIINQLDVAAEVTKQQEIKLASSQKTDLDEYEKRIQEYEELLDKDAGEPEFQAFFEENPNFLEPQVKLFFPKKSLGGEGVPDFLLVLHDSTYLIVELEKPSARLFNKKGDPASDLTHAQQQIRDYLKWAMEEKEYLRKRGCLNISEDNTRGLVVIGKNSTLSAKEIGKLGNINAEVRSRYSVKTFDKILKENRSLLSNLRKMSE